MSRNIFDVLIVNAALLVFANVVPSSCRAAFINGTETFSGNSLDTTTWQLHRSFSPTDLQVDGRLKVFRSMGVVSVQPLVTVGQTVTVELHSSLDSAGLALISNKPPQSEHAEFADQVVAIKHGMGYGNRVSALYGGRGVLTGNYLYGPTSLPVTLGIEYKTRTEFRNFVNIGQTTVAERLRTFDAFPPELYIALLNVPGPGASGFGEFDSVRIVPEPSALAIFGACSMGVFAKFRGHFRERFVQVHGKSLPRPLKPSEWYS